MRVLFTCRPAFGHYAPLVGLARALQDAGHVVTFATAAPLADQIRRDGFEVDEAGLSAADISARRDGDPRYAPARDDPRLRRPLNFELVFAGFEVPARLADLERVIDQRRPDLVVHETAEFAGPLVAAIHGLPAVNHSFGPLVEPNVMLQAGRSAAEHWVERGLPPPERGGMYDNLYLDIVPPGIQFAEIESVQIRHLLRPEPYTRPNDGPPPWDAREAGRPLVAVTLGTIHGQEVAVFRAILDGLADLDVDVVAATSSAEITAALAPHPDNARVYDWLPWAGVLARANLAVTHAGAGSTLACLYYGVPPILVPLGADHFTNCRALGPSGAAVVLERESLTGDAVRQAVFAASSAPAQEAARRLEAEISEMPSPSEVAELLASMV